MFLERLIDDKVIENRFAVLIERWGLEDHEIEELVRVDLPEIRPDVWQPQTERIIRILVELDTLLCSLMGFDGVAPWLRDPGVTGLDPLTFMSLDFDHLRAMLLAARHRSEAWDDFGEPER